MAAQVASTVLAVVAARRDVGQPPETDRKSADRLPST